MKQLAPAAARNREPIREVLARHLPPSGVVLEFASGTGEHAVHFARAFPGITWQPTDIDDTALASIAAWREEVALPNLRAPLRLDVTAKTWPAADAIVCINMIHISPWEATLALFAGAARTLPPGGVLFTYGPYLIDGQTAPSNLEFDRSLKTRDPRWGVREVTDLRAAAAGFRSRRSSRCPRTIIRSCSCEPSRLTSTQVTPESPRHRRARSPQESPLHRKP